MIELRCWRTVAGTKGLPQDFQFAEALQLLGAEFRFESPLAERQIEGILAASDHQIENVGQSLRVGAMPAVKTEFLDQDRHLSSQIPEVP